MLLRGIVPERSEPLRLCSALKFSVLVYTPDAHKAGWRASPVQSILAQCLLLGSDLLGTCALSS